MLDTTPLDSRIVSLAAVVAIVAATVAVGERSRLGPDADAS